MRADYFDIRKKRQVTENTVRGSPLGKDAVDAGIFILTTVAVTGSELYHVRIENRMIQLHSPTLPPPDSKASHW